MYHWRHLVENYFAKIKEFRSIATRYDKTAESFSANINLVAAVVAARYTVNVNGPYILAP